MYYANRKDNGSYIGSKSGSIIKKGRTYFFSSLKDAEKFASDKKNAELIQDGDNTWKVRAK